ncbi:uncharacterized protein EDB91DRAFT_1147431 [Suillus paluster]|uniref:uncharacterized protein n=1 Tax=Suillus paluster TaxID=48578 RepID=UPI001B86911F|nr:uncharacterized protein EDB91DRAFT_1147431 [Suillus paluster]KAG1734076.1 hypothetical protein EDB91DRAFT_1147431 [Suillus paluster]
MRDITALDHHMLLMYHYECGVAAQALGSLSWLGSSYKNVQDLWRSCSCRSTSGTRMVNLQVPNLPSVAIPLWFNEYLVSCGKDLFARPCGSTLLESAYHYNRAIVRATECNYCRSTAVDSMGKFRALYVAQVDKVVETVSSSCQLIHHRCKAYLASVGEIEGGFLNYLPSCCYC